VKQKEAQKEEI